MSGSERLHNCRSALSGAGSLQIRPVAKSICLALTDTTPHLSARCCCGSDADAQFILGFKYTSGDGSDQNYQKAVKWYRLAAEQGMADALTFDFDGW